MTVSSLFGLIEHVSAKLSIPYVWFEKFMWLNSPNSRTKGDFAAPRYYTGVGRFVLPVLIA
jgi:hypothetical protein